ncbi:hypothetical protein BV22DRAFT_841701 [Leucogyrophana mollusca]|uniref:Uncharacterized protein n=1 Tax=Leucogyrophana mollusca TaxID=85980 RepID=A0ACB8B343_9AGAM|nr:hypothetical protein BV22DRAFT_841701 [Leucogyrophana mollusca]
MTQTLSFDRMLTLSTHISRSLISRRALSKPLTSPFCRSLVMLGMTTIHCLRIELFSPSQRSDDSYFDDDHTMDYILCEQSEAHHTSTSYANNLMFSPPSRLPATTEQPQGVAPWLTNALWSPIVHPEGDELESLSIAETPEQHGVSPLPSPYSAAAPSLSRSPNLQLVPLSPEVSQISDIPEDPSLLAPHDAFPEGQSPTSQPAGATPSPSARVLEKRKRDPSPFIPRDDEAEDDADSGDEYIPSLPAGSRQSKRRKTSQTARPSREITSSHSARIGKPKKVLRKTLTLQKKLRCQYCAKTSFTREHDVRRHEERSCSANPNRETEGCECPCCGTVLSRIDSMKRHVRSKHGREYSPP